METAGDVVFEPFVIEDGDDVVGVGEEGEWWVVGGGW